MKYYSDQVKEDVMAGHMAYIAEMRG